MISMRPHMARSRAQAGALAGLLFCLSSQVFPGRLSAQEATPEAQKLRAELEALRQDYQTKLADLEARLAQLEASGTAVATAPQPPPPQVPAGGGSQTPSPPAADADLLAAARAAAAAAMDAAPTSPPPMTIVSGAGGKNFLNLSLDGLLAGGSSTASDVGSLQLGGHDPIQRGFTIQNVETVFEGAVDPYFRGQANVVLQIDADGETVVELEEAYLTSTSLPMGLQVKAGQFFTEFGRLNPTHPHSWDFVDQPLVNGRMFGPDGLRSAGARLSWLMPTNFYSEAMVSVQNGHGETLTSFRQRPWGDPVRPRDRTPRRGELLRSPYRAAIYGLVRPQRHADSAGRRLGGSRPQRHRAAGPHPHLRRRRLLEVEADERLQGVPVPQAPGRGDAAQRRGRHLGRRTPAA